MSPTAENDGTSSQIVPASSLLPGLLPTAVAASAEGIFLVDMAGFCIYANAAAAGIVGYEVHQIEGQHLHSLVHHTREDGSPYPAEDCPIIGAATAGRMADSDDEVLWCAGGVGVPVDLRARPLRIEERLVGAVVTLSDARKRRAALQLAQANEERFRRQFDHAPVGLALASLDGKLSAVNPAYCQITGFSQADLLGRHIKDLAHPDDHEAAVAKIELLRSGSADAVNMEKRYLRRDGSTVWVLVNVSLNRDSDGTPTQIQAVAQDITERRRMESELSHRASHDALTGLANREHLNDRLGFQLSRRGPRRGSLSVLFIDLDQFKLINDGYGHAAGDAVLVEVAGRLRTAVRSGDTVCRFAGDEFVVVLEQLRSPEEAVAVAHRIQAVLATPVLVGACAVHLSASVGIAFDELDDLSADSLLRDADTAMFEAKNRGRARCILFDEALRGRARARLEMLSDLRDAHGRGELHLVYQPIMELGTGAAAGVEALVRWTHPVRGPIAPVEFIPLAEETGFINELGDWILRTATREVASWPDQRLRCSVNLSARELADPRLLARVREALEASGLSPRRLTLEVTETSVMLDVEEAVRVLEELKQLGVRIAIDDFGTGYASLGYLSRLPVDVLKIDRSFVSGLEEGAEEYSIAAAVIGLAHGLGLETVAEGIETDDQRLALLRMGCEHGQGYFFARPLPAGDVAGVVSRSGGSESGRIPLPRRGLFVRSGGPLR